MNRKKELLLSTFIGLKVEVVNSSDSYLIGVSGRVVDETKNLLLIEKEDGKVVKIPKVSSVFRFYLNDGEVEVKGSEICFRHFERPKKVMKRRSD